MRDSSGAEVCFSIIEAVAVDVVADHFFRNMNNLSVHPNFLSCAFAIKVLPACSIRARRAFSKEPFVLCESAVIIRVNYGELAAC